MNADSPAILPHWRSWMLAKLIRKQYKFPRNSTSTFPVMTPDRKQSFPPVDVNNRHIASDHVGLRSTKSTSFPRNVPKFSHKVKDKVRVLRDNFETKFTLLSANFLLMELTCATLWFRYLWNLNGFPVFRFASVSQGFVRIRNASET